MQDFAQYPGFLQHVGLNHEFFAAGAGRVDVNRREDAFFGDTAVQVHFHVARAFEFFVDDFVHFRAGVHQRSGNDGERARFFSVTCCAKKAFRALQGVRVHATGEDFAGGRGDGVVSAGETGDGVAEDDDVFFVLNQALGLFDDHFRDLDVALRRFVEGGGDDFAAHAALHFGDFFRALVNEQDDEVALRVVVGNGLGDVLQHHGFARFRWRDDEAALAFANGGDKVDHARGDVFAAAVADFEFEHFVGVQRGEVFKGDFVPRRAALVVVDGVDFGEGEVAFVVFRWADFAADGVAGAQVAAADEVGRDVDVVGVGLVGVDFGAQEAVAVRDEFEGAIAGDFFATFGMRFEDTEDEVLFAFAGDVVQSHGFGKRENFLGAFLFEIAKVH
ncbi:hypothetical protein HMPREF9080_00936 [Cardiobacterium valvarum F0432]|uniref:Uncharacterized protein n=1 Tax=Cardiobacterium valvarum F0432 TaxID=797473 RepID=G9ZDV2_9GAMM|nr:hypothetical protein HMPREF9080_00936 [Cardiobacterium valvarum F0432]